MSIENFIHIKEKITDQEINSFVDKLSYVQKDSLYRKLWKEYVIEDISAMLKGKYKSEFDEETISSISNECADKYVYEGKYDCNVPYWDNIEALIQSCILEEQYEK